MKISLSILATITLLCLATGCVSVKHEEPAATTRTTTVSAPVAPASVSTSTTTY